MAKKGFIMTQDHKDKISAAKKGKPITWKCRRPFEKGHTPWNKGVSKKLNNCLDKWREDGGVAWSRGMKGDQHPLAGRKKSEETRKKMSNASKKRVEDGTCNLWKGGVRKINAKERRIIMDSFEYKDWRRKVFERDDYTCQDCMKKGGTIQADHIMPFSDFPELRTELSNGKTLCIPCHKKKTKEYYALKRTG